MTQEKHNNKENKSNLVTIEVKAITTVADANEVILRNRAAMTEYVRTELQKQKTLISSYFQHILL